MTPEQRAAEIVGLVRNELNVAPRTGVRLELAIAAALKPSAAVKEVVRLFSAETDYWHDHCDGCDPKNGSRTCPDEHCAVAHAALAAVRKELGL